MGTNLTAAKKAKLDFASALRQLVKLRISCRGPFVTAKGQRIYMVDHRSILLEEEILDLHLRGKLNPTEIHRVGNGETIPSDS